MEELLGDAERGGNCWHVAAQTRSVCASLRDAEFLGGVVEGDDALRIEDALGVPADEADPETMLGGPELRPRGSGREVSADLHAGG